MGFLSKTGKDSIDIAGHKIPIALIGGLAAVAGVLLLLRARSQGAGVTAGSPPAAVATGAATDPVTGLPLQLGAFPSSDAASLANIEQQLTGIQQQINQPVSVPIATPTPTPTPAPAAAAGSPADVFWHQVLGNTSATPSQDVTALELGNVSWQVQHGQLSVNQATSGFIPAKK